MKLRIDLTYSLKSGEHILFIHVLQFRGRVSEFLGNGRRRPVNSFAVHRLTVGGGDGCATGVTHVHLEPTVTPTRLDQFSNRVNFVARYNTLRAIVLAFNGGDTATVTTQGEL